MLDGTTMSKASPATGGNPVFLALDISDVETAVSMAKRLAPYLGGIKLGMEFFYANGVEGYKRVREVGLPIFLDLKLHDIPATVAAGVRSLTRLEPAMLTIHAGGGIAMMRAALEAARESQNPPRITAVGLLTSLEDADLKREGIEQTAAQRTEYLGANAIEAGVDALVCSPKEIALLRKRWGEEVLLVTPGIRPEGSEKNDQKRAMTPTQAQDLGADILVIGRPILHAGDPEAVAQAICESLGVRRASGR